MLVFNLISDLAALVLTLTLTVFELEFTVCVTVLTSVEVALVCTKYLNLRYIVVPL